ncbi:MAG: Tim44 domain-containing protein [Hymenobacter sp.]|nr:MAG: Tim44 domain-containing protein [Hymenobacter sp.]
MCMNLPKTHVQRLPGTLLGAIALVGLAAGYCLGRAGGGSGHASSNHSYSSHGSYSGQGDGGAVFLLLLLGVVAVLVYLAVQNHQLKSELNEKFTAVRNLTEELAKQDPLWNLQTMTSRVNEVFYKVQAAWAARDQELARDCLSDKLYHRHKTQTDQMLAEKTRNVLENILLVEVLIYSVADYQDNARDTFAAQLTGSMIDYTVKEARGYVTVGDRVNPQEFTEVWFFVRQKDQWVLTEIAPLATAEIISYGRSYSES